MFIRFAGAALLAVAVAVTSGCSSMGGGESEAGADGGVAVEDRGASTSGAQAGGAWTGSPLENPDSPLYTKVIYFDFDQSSIRPEFIDTLKAHATYLITSGAPVTLEGHADERGSREYNIALGERRAITVRRFLEAEGVPASQLTTVSYGEERPADPGYGDASWAANRRAVLVY